MVVIERLFIDAGGHALEAIHSTPSEAPRGVFVLCHPYPRYGGDMFHKVVVKAAEVLLKSRFSVVRFNLRGTGRSTGPPLDNAGAREDLDAVLRWAQEKEPDRPLWLGGYSYGAYVALSALMPRREGSFHDRYPVKGVMAVAFPAGLPAYKLDVFPDVAVHFIHGLEDALIPPAVLKGYLSARGPRFEVQWVPGANHFFDGKLTALQEAFHDGLGALGALD